MFINPPTSEKELLDRARQLAGLTLADLAHKTGQNLPKNLLHAKGWIGQLLELALGATANSLAEPDFQLIGVELKTLPLTASGKPKESTYVCTIPLTDLRNQSWDDSWVKRKLQRVLWVPLEGDKQLPLNQRHIGNAILWSPKEDVTAQLKLDWEEHMDHICLGQLDHISSHMGKYLQVRPKGANAKSLTPTFNEEGHSILTLPRGFYLRPEFTQQIIQANYA